MDPFSVMLCQRLETAMDQLEMTFRKYLYTKRKVSVRPSCARLTGYVC